MSTTNKDVVNDILKKIEREKNIVLGIKNLRKESTNSQVIQKCNTSIREAQKNIEYLEQTLNNLTLKANSGSNANADNSFAGDVSNTSIGSIPGSTSDPRTSGENNGTSKPAFTVLDLLRYECPSLGHRIQYMLQQLEFKIQVEEKYKEANEKMIRLYQQEDDRRSAAIAMAEGDRVEGDRKIQLMKKSMKQYQSMHIDVDQIARETAVMNTFRKNPLSGEFTIKITAIRNVDHIASPKFSKNPETIVSIKIDDIQKERTKASRNDHWNDEFVIRVDKANEIGLTVYDKSDDQLIPVGLLWIPLSDVAEEIRRKKVNQVNQSNQNWMNASSLQQSGRSTDDRATLVETSPTLTDDSEAKTASITSTCWFELQPTGQILVTIGFNKTTNKSSGGEGAFGGALGRHGAIRQRKEEVVEHHGHKFVQKQFYNIMCCAVCGDFLRNTGYQCEDCRFLCHKKCYKNVINKCISISSTDRTPEETKVNHRIPHRFEQVANRGTKWCCHCGYILPWGRKNIRKCSECGIMCHAQCSHLVPDFCGMSFEKVSQILNAIKFTEEHRTHTQQLRSNRSSNTLVSSNGPPVPAKYASSISSGATAVDNSSVSYLTTPKPVKSIRRPPPSSDDTSSLNTPKPVKSIRRPPPSNSSNNYNQSYDGYNDGSKSVEEIPSIPQSGAYNSANQARDQVYQDKKRSEIQQNQHQRQQQISLESSQRKHMGKRRHRPKYGLDDFNFLAVLGKGNFGKVMLAESVHTNSLCAIKVLKKDFIISNDEVESTKSEKRVFLIANKGRHPFLVNLHQCFQTENRIYFVMEYISGGDLMWHVQKERFTLRRAQFYAAEVLLALKFLHENGVIYRDLKLDNILLSVDGHIKLADYGLCKEEMWHGNTTSTFCGTPELMAPEILKEQGYDKAVDWWAFGVLLYQMLLTKSPFKGDDEDEIFNAILADEPLYPINMAREAVDILQRLLTRDPTQRLGSSERDALEIMEHPYFANIDFDDILHCRVTPPYIPDVKDPRDLNCFDEEFTSQAAKLTPVNSLLEPKQQEMFRGFTYVNEDLLDL